MSGAYVSITERGAVPIAHLAGEVDVANVDEVRERLVASVPNTAAGVIVDLSGTTYIDSAGIRMLIELADRLAIHQQRACFVIPRKSLVRRVFLITHVDEKVPLCETVDEAMAQIVDTTNPPG